jgi:Bacterial PH domain
VEAEPPNERLDSFVWGNLKRLNELGTLALDEMIVDHERVGLGTAPGLLLVTDRRVLYFRASPLTGKSRLVSLPLSDIVDVEASERRSPIRKTGVLTVRSTVEDSEAVTFEYIAGGIARAKEIPHAITRQRNLLGGPA